MSSALLAVATEDVRQRVLGTLARVGVALLGPGGVRDLVAPFAAGATDCGEARERIAQLVIDRGGRP